MLGVAAGIAAGVAASRWLDVVEVRGGSMAPSLLPGDRLLVESRSYQAAPRVPGRSCWRPTRARPTAS